MGTAYLASWDMTKLNNTFYIKVSSSGKTTFNVQFTGSGSANTYYMTDQDANSANLYNHLDIHDIRSVRHTGVQPYLSTFADDSFGNLLEDTLNAGNTAEAWGGAFTVTLSTTTWKYTISHSTVSFSIAVGTSEEGLYLLGFSATQTAASSHTSTYVPKCIVLSDLDNASMVSDEYESGSPASLAMSDGGYHVGLARTLPIVNADWEQQFEPHASTHARKAAYFASYSTGKWNVLPWTYQSLFEHCRTIYPFVVANEDMWTDYYPVYILREDGCYFRPKRAVPDYDGYWHIPFKTHVIGWYDAS